MFSSWQLVTLSIFYIGLLFVIAYLGDKYRHKLFGNAKAIIYSLTLGVYCTSWSFLGTTGQVAGNVFSHIPIYLGPILLFVFAWSFIKRIIRVSLKLNLTSIADLLAARFGKSHNLAILVTIVALIGTLPYMALQLKAIVYSFDLLQLESDVNRWQLGLIVTLVMAGFTIIFGIRHIDVNECHPGVMLAIAFESLIKLIAFIVVGVFVCFSLFDSPTQIWQQANIDMSEQLSFPNITAMVGMLIIVMAAFLSLPRQFQVMVVETSDIQDTKYSRQVFCIYVLIFALIAVPLGLAGQLLFDASVDADAYVLLLPGLKGQTFISLFTFLGAISAASSMMIISAIALSTMMSNELIFPVIFRGSNPKEQSYEDFRDKLLNIRKVLVLIITLLGYCAFLLVSPERLASLGEIAFGAIAQLTPALVAAFYWRYASLTGVYSGILVGFTSWCMLNFFPNLGLYIQPLNQVSFSENTTATLISLGGNIITMIIISLLSRQSVHERVQASFFAEEPTDLNIPPYRKQQVDQSELKLLLSNFLGDDKTQECFQDFTDNNYHINERNPMYYQRLLEHCEHALATVMGSSSARLVINSALEGRNINLTELAKLVEESSSQQQLMNQHLLRSAIENASEGISVIDKQLNLVAWNKKYLEIFNYPNKLVFEGAPIESIIRYNAHRGFCGSGNIENEVQKRLNHLRRGTSHTSEKQHETGQVIRIEGNPLPDGGFVMIFRDITTYRQAESVLKAQKSDLESVVHERTKKLEHVNEQLAIARHKAEQANHKKSLYLKACSHDLMQPLEAARLFTSALAMQEKLSHQQKRQVDNIDQALKVANELLASLSEISSIESGNIIANIESFNLGDLFEQLDQEFGINATEKAIEFHVKQCHVWIKSDKHLLRRILQNLLTNAFRYASPGVVTLNADVNDGEVDIQVIDNGPGIKQENQEMVFEQFVQLDNGKNHIDKGLGLGLNITQSLAKIIGHSLELKSIDGQGCRFSIKLPIVDAITSKPSPALPKVGLQGLSVLCIDNDPKVLAGMLELLDAWQCNAVGVSSKSEALTALKRNGNGFEILLVDYQLDHGENGLYIIAEIRKKAQRQIPAILITATTDLDIEEKTAKANVGFMRKMVKPAALRAMISAMLAKSLKANYLN